MEKFNKFKAVKLAERFPTASALAAATLEDIKAVRGIGPVIAQKVYLITSGAATVGTYAGEKRVPVWNKITKKKVTGAAAPRASVVQDWLVKKAATHELYDDQDQRQEGPKGPSTVPADCVMSADDYKAFCEEADDGNGEVRLQTTLANYRLQQVSMPVLLRRSPSYGT